MYQDHSLPINNGNGKLLAFLRQRIQPIQLNVSGSTYHQQTNSLPKPVLYPARVIPCGIHGRGDGLHKFQVDSMEWWMESMEWGMDSMEWWMDSMVFPHGFHTFSTWTPYGMSSWNHNSTLIHKFKTKYWVV